MGIFTSIEKEAKEAAQKVAAQFPGSTVSAEVKDKVVTLSGTAPDVATKGRIMDAFSKLVPDAENVVNVIRAERPGSGVPASPMPSAGSAIPIPSITGGPAPAGGSVAASTPSRTAPQDAAHDAGRTHVVEKGDTLSAIAKKYYGKANDYMKIFNANKDVLKDPDKIFPGQKLKIPD